MATLSPGKLLTAEEFMELPDPIDGSKQELVKGVIVTMPPPMAPHGYSSTKVTVAVGSFVEQHKLGVVVSNDTGVIVERGPDTVRGPDVAFYSFARQPTLPEGYFEIGPDLAVEVLSPSNTLRKIEAKIREYLSAGTRLVWIVSPMDRTVTVYRTDPLRGVLIHSGTMLDGEDVLPGFSYPVASLFPPAPPDSEPES